VGTLAVLTKHLHGRPIVVSVRGSDILGPNAFIRRLTAWTIARSDAVSGNTPVSHRAASAFCRAQTPCRYIPNGVYLPNWQELTTTRDGRTDHEVRIVCVGRLVRERRQDLLIRAMAQLLAVNKDTRLILLGDGPERPGLEALSRELDLAEKVRFVGRVPRPAVRRYLSHADIYASPTASENFANAVLEAAAHGLPVVATRVGFPAEVVQDGRTGALVEPGDAGALTRALAALLESPEKRLRAGRRMRQRLENLGLTWSDCAAKTIALYRKTCEKRG
jgi:glycosyltransferase involved in cell wall biosynthesis